MDIERPATGPADTFQYWITPKLGYDIRTFAIAKNIRVLELDLSGKREEDLVPMLLSMAQRTYEGIIEREVRIDVTASDTVETLTGKVNSAGLFPHVEWNGLDFPLWLPEHVNYESLSE